MMMSAHGLQGMPQMQQMQPTASAQTNCPNCNTALTFPYGSVYIQCPNCSMAFNPQPPPMPQPIAVQPPQPHPQQHGGVSYINCVQCQALLSYAPASVTIQCPKCLTIMDLPPARASAVNVVGAIQPAAAGSVGNAASSAAVSKEAIAARKKRKDPNAPKRASNAYMIFCKERRAQLKQDRPDLPFGQLGKRLGEMWRSMSIEEKKHYEDRATNDRDRYKGEMSSYQSNAMMRAAARGEQHAQAAAAAAAAAGGGGGGRDHHDEDDDRQRRKADQNGADKKQKLAAAQVAGPVGGDDYHHSKHDSYDG